MICTCLPKKYRIGKLLAFIFLASLLIFGYMSFFSDEYRPDFGDPLIITLLSAALIALFLFFLLFLFFTSWESSEIEITASGLIRRQRLRKDRLIPWSEIYSGRVTLTCFQPIYGEPLPILQFVLDEKTEKRGDRQIGRFRLPLRSDVWFNAEHCNSVVIFTYSKEAEALVRRYYPKLEEDDSVRDGKGKMIWPLQ